MLSIRGLPHQRSGAHRTRTEGSLLLDNLVETLRALSGFLSLHTSCSLTGQMASLPGPKNTQGPLSRSSPREPFLLSPPPSPQKPRAKISVRLVPPLSSTNHTSTGTPSPPSASERVKHSRRPRTLSPSLSKPSHAAQSCQLQLDILAKQGEHLKAVERSGIIRGTVRRVDDHRASSGSRCVQENVCTRRRLSLKRRVCRVRHIPKRDSRSWSRKGGRKQTTFDGSVGVPERNVSQKGRRVSVQREACLRSLESFKWSAERKRYLFANSTFATITSPCALRASPPHSSHPPHLSGTPDALVVPPSRLGIAGKSARSLRACATVSSDASESCKASRRTFRSTDHQSLGLPH